MNCIKIINDLAGGNRPDWILKAWIGCILPLNLPYSLFSRGQIDLKRVGPIPAGAVFSVDARLAILIQDLHNQLAAKWWLEESGVTEGDFSFCAECCELVEGVPSITKTRDTSTQVTVADFLDALSVACDYAFTPTTRSLSDLFHGDQLAKVLQSALTPAIVLLIANEVTKTARFAVEGASSEDYMDQVLKDGHGTLQTIHLIADRAGVNLPIHWVNRPLSIVEEMECAGLAQVVDGNVHLVPRGQLPPSLTKH